MSVSVEEASDAGQKSIEHLTGIDGSCSSRADDFHLSSQQDLAEMIAAGKSSLAGGFHLATMGVSILTLNGVNQMGGLRIGWSV